MPSISGSARAIRAGVFAELQRRIDAHQQRGGDLVPLQIGDTAVDPPKEARFEGGDDAALYRYGATAGLALLRNEIARFRPEFSADPEAEVLVGAGGTHAIFCAMRSVLDPGDEVILFSPYWPLAHGILSACGAKIVEVSVTDRLYADPSLDLRTLLTPHLTEKTRAIYLITPNNPDGKILSRGHLEQVAELASERDLWVLADEVYADHAFDQPHVSIATLPGMRARTITASSLSKSHALAGARIGWVIAPPDVVTAARRVSTHTVFNVPVIAQRAAIGALRGGREWAQEAASRYREARDQSARALRDLPVRFHLAEGATYLFIDFAPALHGRSLEAFLETAIDRGVLLAPGRAFGSAYETWARLCYSAVPPDRLAAGLERLRAALVDFAP
ncbi:MAG: pyridoxal phosphate-dependent aminotransferase [Polyangiales bacterium]